MAQYNDRNERVARLVRAGELLVSGENPEEADGYFAPGFEFHGPGGFDSDFQGLAAYFASLRDAFEDRSIRRGIMAVEGNTLACQTWIEGTFVRDFTQSPIGSIPPNGRRIVFDLINIFVIDDEGRLTHEYVRTDNHSLLQQLQAPAEPS
jgi:predicted ester cyclase